MSTINYGVHTCEVSKVLTAKQYFEIKSSIHKKRDCYDDYFTSTEKIYVDKFSKRGIKIYLSSSDSFYTLKVPMEPCRILDDDNPRCSLLANKKELRKDDKESR